MLLGANGQLGHAFMKSRALALRGEVVPATRQGCLDGRPCHSADLADTASLNALLDRVQPDLIINAAAYTAVDQAESEEPLATRINGHALAVLGGWAAKHHALIVHYSTDYLFDGTKAAAYGVDDTPSPINAYGRSKLAGELALRASGASHFIFRTAWVYSPHGRNFFLTMLQLAKQQPELRIVNDQFGTPTPASLIVDASLAAVDQWQLAPPAKRISLEGTYHVVSDGVATWHDFATRIFRKASDAGLLQGTPKIVAVGTGDYPTPARRPAWSVLDNASFRHRFGFELPDWRDGLDDTINKLYSEVNGPTC
nr:dTDP-4-dehydrorhamnose reductase [Dyella sp. ASV21]